jgi:hypothetical protein
MTGRYMTSREKRASREIPALTGEHGTSLYGPSRANADMMTEDAKFALGF